MYANFASIGVLNRVPKHASLSRGCVWTTSVITVGDEISRRNSNAVPVVAKTVALDFRRTQHDKGIWVVVETTPNILVHNP